MDANFNANTINSRINKVYDQIEELVELANKFQEYPAPEIRRDAPRPKKYFQLIDFLEDLVNRRDAIRADIESYIENISRKHSDLDDVIDSYKKPTVAPVKTK